MANDDGSHFIAPNLTKRRKLTQVNVVCDVCKAAVLSFTATHEADMTHIEAYCHGKKDALDMNQSYWERHRATREPVILFAVLL